MRDNNIILDRSFAEGRKVQLTITLTAEEASCLGRRVAHGNDPDSSWEQAVYNDFLSCINDALVALHTPKNGLRHVSEIMDEMGGSRD